MRNLLLPCFLLLYLVVVFNISLLLSWYYYLLFIGFRIATGDNGSYCDTFLSFYIVRHNIPFCVIFTSLNYVQELVNIIDFIHLHIPIFSFSLSYLLMECPERNNTNLFSNSYHQRWLVCWYNDTINLKYFICLLIAHCSGGPTPVKPEPRTLVSSFSNFQFQPQNPNDPAFQGGYNNAGGFGGFNGQQQAHNLQQSTGGTYLQGSNNHLPPLQHSGSFVTDILLSHEITCLLFSLIEYMYPSCSSHPSTPSPTCTTTRPSPTNCTTNPWNSIIEM